MGSQDPPSTPPVQGEEEAFWGHGRGGARVRSVSGRKAFMALRMAKKTAMPSISGGSHTALAPSGP